MYIADLPEGARFVVRKVLLDREVGKRLADMGFTEGAEGRVIRRAFFRGPIQVEIRGYSILIRRCEAAGVEVDSDAAPLPTMELGRHGFGHKRHAAASCPEDEQGRGPFRGFGFHRRRGAGASIDPIQGESKGGRQ